MSGKAKNKEKGKAVKSDEVPNKGEQSPEAPPEDLKLKPPIGDVPGNYSGNLNQAKIPVVDSEAVAKSAAISLSLNNPDEPLTKGIYQIKDGYFIDVLIIRSDDVISAKKGIVEKGVISWKTEFKLTVSQMAKFLSKNKPKIHEGGLT